jgi:SAM-dependent methyltransferase
MERIEAAYKDIPIYAGPGLHEDCFEIINGNFKPGSRILDIAAGAGAFSARLKDAGYEVMANDIDEKIWKARNIYKTSYDLNKPLPLEILNSAPYDLVVAMEVIEHLENPRKLLLDCNDLIEIGGHVLISTPNVTDAISRLSFLRKGTFFHFSEDSYKETGHMSILPWWLMELLFDSTGLQVVVRRFGGTRDKERLRTKGAIFSIIAITLKPLMKTPSRQGVDCNYLIYLLRKEHG